MIEHKREHEREHESGDAKSGRCEQREFLDLSGADPSRRCVEALVRELPREGAVPDLAKPLRSVAARLFDLLPVVRAHYYHPDMRGSRSIKAVLPTIGAGLDHAELGKVQDGTGAQEAYLEAVSEGTGKGTKKALEEGLRRYCGMDVRAMVALAGFLGGANRASAQVNMSVTANSMSRAPVLRREMPQAS